MHAQPTILIADREPKTLSSITDNLNLEFKCNFQQIFNDSELESSLNSNSVHILILDLDFSDTLDGLSLIDMVKASHPETAVLPIIPAGKPQLIKKIMERDLFFYIHKPIDPLETAIALKRIHETLSIRPDEKSIPEK